MTEITCSYIDTCYPDYLTDHHSRDNELLICASVADGDSTEDIVWQLLDSVECGPTHLPEHFSTEDIKSAIESEIDPMVSTDFGLRLDLYDAEQDDAMYLYAYLSW